MVDGHGVAEEEKLPLAVDDGSIEWVSEFPVSNGRKWKVTHGSGQENRKCFKGLWGS